MTIIVIGGGQAAVSTAAKYRALGGTDRFIIFSDEAEPPYQRPPLSKGYLAGEMPVEKLYLRPSDWYEKNAIELCLNSPVAALEPHRHQVTLKDGQVLRYDRLVLATGARARPLPQNMANAVKQLFYVRSVADIERMRPHFVSGRRLIVIGGGYIGLEAAAIARKTGLSVTVIEAAERILGRVASVPTADFIRAMHQDRGVMFHEQTGIDLCENTPPAGCRVSLADGRQLKADFIIAGIGILANTELAEQAGLACDSGILVDEYCQTSQPDIFAAGDCTRFFWRGQSLRLESVGNAIDQAEAVAATLAGTKTAYQPKPWFWSDQYDLTLQIAGLNTGYEHTITREGAKPGTKSVWYYRGDQLLAVDALGDARAYMIGKRIIESGKTVPAEAAADPHTDLKAWL